MTTSAPARVVVTGAAGFVGTHLGERLVQDGARVVGADNYSFARPDAPAASPGGMETRRVDLRDAGQMKALFEEVQPELVVHLAAVANPRTCKQDFPLAFDVNVLGTQNVFRFAPPKARVVFMSSASVYGVPEKLPIDESHPRKGNDPYSTTKIIGEDLAASYAKNYDRNIAVVRNFNTFGVGQVGDYIVPQLIRQAIVEHKIELWDPKVVRDLMYVDDTIGALLTIAHSDVRSPINIGSGRGVTIGELATAITGRIGVDVPIVDLHKPASGSTALVSSNERLKALGWSEKVGLLTGIDRTIEWTRGQLSAAKAA